MKIRCNPVEGQDACKACAKVNRQCIMPGPPRKRQKTVHKVAELEKKINALTQSLLTKTQNDPTPPHESPAVTEMSKSSVSNQLPTFSDGDRPPECDGDRPFSKSDTAAQIPRIGTSSDANYVDVIDKGLLTMEAALKIFDRFDREMNILSPVVGFPPNMSLSSLRQRRPMLFLAVMCAACGIVMPHLQDDLLSELARELAERVMFKFEKTLDVCQAMLVICTWCGRHSRGKDLGFSQYIHVAAAIAFDIGLGKRLRHALTKDPLEDLEMRRTWVGIYFNAQCVSCTLRQPAFVRDGPYLQECLDILVASPNSLQTDRILCRLAEVVRISSDTLSVFKYDDPVTHVKLEDPATQYQIKLLENRLADWKAASQPYLHPGELIILSQQLCQN